MDIDEIGEKDQKDASRPSWEKAFRLVCQMTWRGNETELVDQFMDALIALSSAEHGLIVLNHEGKLVVVVARNMKPADFLKAKDELSWTITNKVIATGNPVITIDAMHDPTLSASESIQGLHLKSVCCLPIKTIDGQVHGAMYLDNRSVNNAFVGDNVEILKTFSGLLSGHIETLRIVARLRT